MSRSQSIALGLGLLLIADWANAGVVTISPAVNYHVFDDKARPDATGAEVKDAIQYSLGLGYRFNPAWSVEASYGLINTREEAPFKDDKVYYRSGSLDAMYRFNNSTAFSPYVLAGGGRNVSKTSMTDRATAHGFGEIGGGTLWALNDTVSLRGEARYQRQPSQNLNTWLAAVGVEIALGSFSKPVVIEAPAPVVEAKPEPVVAPQPAPVVVAPPADDDHDGVINDQDKCPNTPEGVKVDNVGCPFDTDHDGVLDYLDQCPDTKAGALVDDKGCYVVLKQNESINLGVNFATNKTEILGDASAELAKVVDFMKKYPNVAITIEGHTDSRGKPAKNQVLSQRRAEAVRDALVKAGVDATRLQAVGYGAQRPVAENKTEAGRAQNRRVVATAKGESEAIQMKKK